MSKRNTTPKVISKRMSKLEIFSIVSTAVLSVIAIVVSIASIIVSINNNDKTNSITEKQNQFVRKMQLSVQSEKDSLQQVHSIVSQTETVSNDILLKESYQPDNKNKLEDLSNTASKIQNNYYNDLNQKNKYAGQLDKAITLSLTNTRNIIDAILSSTENTTNYTTQSTSNTKIIKNLPKTGGQDPHLEEIFNNYQKEEQSQINKNAN